MPKFFVKNETAHYLRRKFHESAKDLRRVSRVSAYDQIEGEAWLEYVMLEGLAEYMAHCRDNGITTAEFTEFQVQFLQSRYPRLLLRLKESD